MGPSQHPPSIEALSPELREYRRQFVTITRDAELLLAGLTDRQVVWRENRNVWSIVDCFDHLVVTANQSLPRIHRAIIEARSRGLFGSGPFMYGKIGTWLVRLMNAPPAIRLKTPRAYQPSMALPASEIVARFFLLQSELIEACDEADGIDLAAVKVSNPVTKWFRLSLGQEFALTAAHERRHLWQAWRVREKLSSGGASPNAAC
jgi:hypothetical protein